MAIPSHAFADTISSNYLVTSAGDFTFQDWTSANSNSLHNIFDLCPGIPSATSSPTPYNSCPRVISSQTGGFTGTPFPVTSFGGTALNSSTVYFPNLLSAGTRGLSDGNYYMEVFSDTWTGMQYFAYPFTVSGGMPVPSGVDTSTHFISLTPTNLSTVATTTSVGSDLYIGGTSLASDLPQGGRLQIFLSQSSASACSNASVAIYAFHVSGNPCENTFLGNIEIDLPSATSTALINGEYLEYATTTLPQGGNWTATYNLQKFFPGYIFGLFSGYQTFISTTTTFTIGTPSAIDIERAAIASTSAGQTASSSAGIGAILASTTAQLSSTCDIINIGSFNLGDCLTLTLLPSTSALQDDLLTIERLPPWGYAFRFIDILTAPASSTTLPTISYNFSSTSPLAAGVGNITFDPLGLIMQSGTFLNSATSDVTGAPENIWQIMNPVVTIVVYLALFLEIIRELTKIDWDGAEKKADRNETNI